MILADLLPLLVMGALAAVAVAGWAVLRHAQPPPEPVADGDRPTRPGGPVERWGALVDEILDAAHHEPPPRADQIERLVDALRAETQDPGSLPPALAHLHDGGHPDSFWHRHAIADMDGPTWWAQARYPLWRWRQADLRTPRRRRRRFLERVVDELEAMEDEQ